MALGAITLDLRDNIVSAPKFASTLSMMPVYHHTAGTQRVFAIDLLDGVPPRLL